MSKCPVHADVEGMINNFDHHSEDFAEHRHAFYRAVHEKGGVIRSEKYGGFLFVGAHAEATRIQRATEIFSNKDLTLPAASFPKIIPAKLDPPEHQEFKKLLTKYFTPQQAEDRRGQVREILDELFLPLRDGVELDVVTEVLQPLVARMSMDIIGYEAPDVTLYTHPIHIASLPEYPHEERVRGMEELIERIRNDVAVLKDEKRGLIGKLAGETVLGRPLTDEELAMIMLNLLVGSLGTTPLFDSSITVFMAENPGHRTELLNNRELLKPAVLEMLRSFSPVQTFARTVQESTSICGFDVKEDEHILLGYGAANHDDSRFPEPDKVDFSRNPRDHMSFGVGPHRCLGSHLAVLTAEEYTLALLSAAPDYTVVSKRAFHDIATKLGYVSVKIRK